MRRMNNDYLDPINALDMPNAADSMLAMDLLLSVKTGIRNYAAAISETSTPIVREMLRNQMNKALDLHEEISHYMINKGWLRPHDVGEQFELDIKSAETTMKIAGMELFPDHTSRLGTYATPEKQS